jgi:hypothetical protein
MAEKMARIVASFATLALIVCLTTGCGSSGDSSAIAVDDHAGHDHAEHSHSGWWCDEHGVPEGVCALCSDKIAAEFKKAGDWCQDHDRPDSQCFVCHPELKAKFAAQYEAKYGKQPPEPKS